MRKKLNILLAILVLALIIYRLGAYENWWSQKEDAAEFKSKYVKEFIRKSPTLMKLDSVNANAIANAYYEKFVQRYGQEKLIEIGDRYANGEKSVYKEYVKPIMDSCMMPYKQVIKDAEYVYDCTGSIVKKGEHSEAEAKTFCQCFEEQMKFKFGDNFPDSIRNDTVLNKEIIQSDCLRLWQK